jgi:hypothetical protein
VGKKKQVTGKGGAGNTKIGIGSVKRRSRQKKKEKQAVGNRQCESMNSSEERRSRQWERLSRKWGRKERVWRQGQ